MNENLDPISHYIKKITENRSMTNIRANTITLLEENIGVRLHDLI